MHRKLQTSALVLAMLLLASLPAVAQDPADDQPAAPPAPPSDVTVEDVDNDAGTQLKVTWTLSPDDKAEFVPRRVLRYDVFRKSAVEEGDEFRKIGEATYQVDSFIDRGVETDGSYLYQVAAVALGDVRSEAVASDQAASPEMQFFDKSRAWFGVIMLIVGGAVVYFIEVARKGKDLKIRKIAGLEAVDEAVGRATEMGRPCLFIPGILDINDMQTVAGITVLSHVAKRVAEYDAHLEVPTARSLVMTTCRETVQASYLSAGRPDAYREDDVYYLTDEQFGYVAGVAGTMVREKPAACFYMGAFYAESLLLAENGNAVGSIQVAGTAMPSQLPFFVAACDYTLIGEEFFAASAYLSGEPHQMGSLKGQDVGKFCGAVLLIIGCGLATVATFVDSEQITAVLVFLRDHVLGNKGFWL